MKCAEAVEGAGEGVGGDGVDLEAGGCARAQGGGRSGDHGVGEPPGEGHDGERSEAETVELRQAAGLEARRHEDRVAPGHQPAGEPLVVADPHGDVRIGGGGLERGLERRFAAAEQRELTVSGDQMRKGREEEV